MRNPIRALGAFSLSLCFVLQTPMIIRAQSSPDLVDSDEFFQRAIRLRSQQRDYSQKIEALLRQMTIEEKVGQMTQLTLEMIVNGHDQSVQIDPAKLQKAIGKYGVGSIIRPASALCRH